MITLTEAHAEHEITQGATSSVMMTTMFGLLDWASVTLGAFTLATSTAMSSTTRVFMISSFIARALSMAN